MYKNINLSQIKSISSLQKDYAVLTKEAKSKGEIIFLKRNVPSVVLVDFSRWQKLIGIEQKNEELLALETIKNSEAEYKSGKAKRLVSLSDL